MSFERLHKWVTYGLVVVSLLPLALSGEIPMPAITAAYAGILWSFFYPVPLRRRETQSRWWNLATVAVLVLLSLLGVATGAWLIYAVLFALFLIVIRLFQSRGAHDTFQLYALTFVAVIAGAVANPDVSFIFVFLTYVVLLVWGLVLLHLQRDLEALADEQLEVGEMPTDRAWQTKSLVTPGFLAGSSVLAIVIFASSLTIFFFFPRLGMGFFFGQGRRGQAMSGFSDRIELGHFGTIKNNHRVVLRVELPEEPDREDRRLRMRGISFDHYDGRVWSKQRSQRGFEMPTSAGGGWTTRAAGDELSGAEGERLVQDIYLEPLEIGQRVIFGQPRILSLALPNPRLNQLKLDRLRFYQDAGDDIATRGRTDTALSYRAVSLLGRPSVETLRRMPARPPPSPLGKAYLQLPEDLDPRIAALARQVTRGLDTDIDKVLAVEKHLRESYTYSTEGGHDPDHPLSSFLFDLRRGHCEYFATAMVVMLRTLGIPARPANGFWGGVYNDYGRYYAMRQADAHSWVEVHFGEHGWLTFDPTPPSMVLVPPDDGAWGAMEMWFDSLKLSWYKWVVEYDLEKQIDFFRDIAARFRGLMPERSQLAADRGQWKEAALEWLKSPWLWGPAAGLILLLLGWRLRLVARLRALIDRRRARQARVPGGLPGSYYAGLLRRLARQGFERRPAETPSQLADRVASAGHPSAEPIARLTRAFEEARYGGGGTEADPGALARDLSAVARRRR